MTLTARFPDGTMLSREVYLDDDEGPSLTSEGQSGGSGESSAHRFGKENETAWGRIGARGGHVTLGKDVAFDAAPGALKSDVSIGIRHEMPESVPPLDPGMVNVTAPAGAALPVPAAGQRFARP